MGRSESYSLRELYVGLNGTTEPAISLIPGYKRATQHILLYEGLTIRRGDKIKIK